MKNLEHTELIGAKVDQAPPMVAKCILKRAYSNSEAKIVGLITERRRL